NDVVASGHVQNLVVTGNGEVRFTFQVRPDDPGGLVKEARAAAEAVDGVASVKVNVQLPQTAPGGAGPHRGRGSGGLQPGSVPAPTPQPGVLPEVAHVVAVSSGKGGVGKSMVATNLAVALAGMGLRVGLLDADIYGPNIPRMFGEERRPRVTGGKGEEMIEPLEAHGVRLMSLGLLLEKEQPAIMRGPLISGILKQFMQQVQWGALDMMVVDMPPGTGDAQLSLVQTIDLDGALMVTTPQEVATGDVRRGVRMFERVNTRVLGIVENMAGFVCPHCGEVTEVFGRGGGERLAEDLEVPFLGRVPLDATVATAGDRGEPTVVSAPDSAAAAALRQVAEAVAEAVAVAGVG
ncbi:MAG TPA: Mrp/NBP35 family ATP-binding protein, partial [Longimicrobiales bacterium]|nr:Mrp/NBP35 family ATP-binding protein [Longimicrobiales bacterium]